MIQYVIEHVGKEAKKKKRFSFYLLRLELVSRYTTVQVPSGILKRHELEELGRISIYELGDVTNCSSSFSAGLRL